MFLKLAKYLIVYLCSSVEHGYYETFDCEVRIRIPLHKTYGLKQFSKTFKRLYGITPTQYRLGLPNS